MMPQPHTLKIFEIFPSIQGEGLRQGEATLFIRLSGCNLKCSFCDTKWAWQGGKQMSTTVIVRTIERLHKRFPAEWVCLTGGEPLLQDITDVTRNLKKHGFKIQVETNATIFRSLPVDWYTISPKPDEYFFQPEYKKLAKEVKIIVTRELLFETIEKLRGEFPQATPILLQPQSNRKWSMDLGLKLLKKSIQHGLNNIRLSVQLHKVYGIR
ncbi:MAG: 7-carboxy-7-deazaguanine synthase QueE [Candidatus Aminicenantes bacterium]|nr:7-carboxy-7-deazaguanine synthase QueE [Candidatus Aminicenantes bacterium]